MINGGEALTDAEGLSTAAVLFIFCEVFLQLLITSCLQLAKLMFLVIVLFQGNAVLFANR